MNVASSLKPPTHKPRVGFTAVGRHRLEALSALGQISVCAVADPVMSNHAAIRALLPAVTCTQSFEALLNLDLDAVVIGGPTAQHSEQAIAALDLAAYRNEGNRRQLLCGPPDGWRGRALAAWAQRLVQGQRFDPECRSWVALSAVLDALYARCRG